MLDSALALVKAFCGTQTIITWDREPESTMSMDRISQIRIGGVRAIEQLTLDLKGLSALIGDNGTGKSTVIEALQILHSPTYPISSRSATVACVPCSDAVPASSHLE